MLKDWQTLIAGGAALGAAIITVRVMMRQVRLQQEQIDEVREAAEDQRQRKLFACRAVMPADLSSIIQYTHECAFAAGLGIQMIRDGGQRKPLTCPKLPGHVISNLQRLMEQFDEENAKHIADLLSCYQIQYARLSGEIGYFNTPDRLGTYRVMTEHNMEFTLEKTVELFLRAESMLKFARREIDAVPELKPSEEAVGNALRILEISDVIDPEYSEQLLTLLASDDH